MRVAIAFPQCLMDFHVEKDGLLARGMEALGHEAIFVCPESCVADPPFDVRVVALPEWSRPGFWAALEVDVAVVYTWMGYHGGVVEALRRAGVATVSKGDTDGNLGYRAHPRATFMRTVGAETGFLARVRTARDWLKRFLLFYQLEDASVIENLVNADRTFFETNTAREHFRRFLAHYGLQHLERKLFAVPMPVSTDLLRAAVPPERARQVVAIGRWEAYQKGTPLLVATLRRYLRRHPEAEVVLIGSGGDRAFRGLTRDFPRVKHLGVIPHDAILEQLAGSRVCLITSRWESFHSGAHEALAMGCTLVGPAVIPIPDVVGAGPYGTVSPTRRVKDVAAALETEMRAWEAGERQPAEIARAWRARLDPAEVAGQILASVAASRLSRTY